MAVTIDEMHVDVKEAQPAAKGQQAGAEPKREPDLRGTLALLRDRQRRLRAD